MTRGLDWKGFHFEKKGPHLFECSPFYVEEFVPGGTRTGLWTATWQFPWHLPLEGTREKTPHRALHALFVDFEDGREALLQRCNHETRRYLLYETMRALGIMVGPLYVDRVRRTVEDLEAAKRELQLLLPVEPSKNDLPTLGRLIQRNLLAYQVLDSTRALARHTLPVLEDHAYATGNDIYDNWVEWRVSAAIEMLDVVIRRRRRSG